MQLNEGNVLHNFVDNEITTSNYTESKVDDLQLLCFDIDGLESNQQENIKCQLSGATLQVKEARVQVVSVLALRVLVSRC